MDESKKGTEHSVLGMLRWGLANWLEIMAGTMLVAICIIVFMGVFFRYFLHIGLGWTEELARYLQVWMTFIGATIAVKRWSHYQLTLVHQVIPTRAHRFTSIFGMLVVMGLAAVMIKNGADITRVSWEQTSPIMGWNFGYLYLVVPLSGVLMEFFAIRHLVRAFKGNLPRVDDHSAAANLAKVEL